MSIAIIDINLLIFDRAIHYKMIFFFTSNITFRKNGISKSLKIIFC